MAHSCLVPGDYWGAVKRDVNSGAGKMDSLSMQPVLVSDSKTMGNNCQTACRMTTYKQQWLPTAVNNRQLRESGTVDAVQDFKEGHYGVVELWS